MCLLTHANDEAAGVLRCRRLDRRFWCLELGHPDEQARDLGNQAVAKAIGAVQSNASPEMIRNKKLLS
jgi:hypothetical protein